MFNLTEANIVTTTRTEMVYVVTTHRIANFRGRSVPQRARALINIVHPEFREGLERQAYENRLTPGGIQLVVIGP